MSVPCACAELLLNSRVGMRQPARALSAAEEALGDTVTLRSVERRGTIGGHTNFMVNATKMTNTKQLGD